MEYSDKFKKRITELFFREGWDKLSREELLEKVSETLEDLVKSGQVERLIGEDGHFYYRSIKKKQ